MAAPARSIQAHGNGAATLKASTRPRDRSAKTKAKPALSRSTTAIAVETEQLIAAIAEMDLHELRAFWIKRYGPPPPLRSLNFLRLNLAWRVQADAEGGLDRDLRRRLQRRGRDEAEGLDLGIGTRLQRTWEGKLYEVIIEEEGFRFDGILYPSLSAAARAITGSRWNGPRFFGLRDKT